MKIPDVRALKNATEGGQEGMKKNCAIITALAMLFFVLTPLSLAAAADDYIVAVNQSQVLTFNGIQRIAIANPEIADVVVVSGSEVLLLGKAPGGTTLHVWSSEGKRSFQVNVAAQDRQIAGEIQRLLGYSDLQVGKINQTIVLEGTVSDQYQRSRAEKAAGAYGEKVVNLLELRNPKQVKIEAKILEINKDKTDKLGIRWGNAPSAPGVFALGQSYTAANSIAGQNQVFGWFGSYADLNAQIDALVQTGEARVLASPHLIALSGEKASVLVGGEIPVPVSVSNGQIAIEWKSYGVKLLIEPEVNSEQFIQSKVQTEVSSVDWNSTHRIFIGSGLSIPPLTMRKAETTIVLKSGQTLVVGGLISEQVNNDVYKIPLLGDLPLLGPMFRSKSITHSRTELIILLTPTVIDPVEYQPLITGGMQELFKENPWQEGEKNEERRDKSSNR